MSQPQDIEPSEIDRYNDFNSFLKLLTQNDRMHGIDPIVFFQCYPEGPHKNDLQTLSYFPSPLSASLDCFKILTEQNNKGYSCNFAFNELGIDGDVTGGRRKENCSRVRSFSVDIDYFLPIPVLEQVIELVQPNIVVASSKDPSGKEQFKIHLYWLHRSTVPEKNKFALDVFEESVIKSFAVLQTALAYRVEELIKKLFTRYTDVKNITDKNVTGLAGTLRLPGFLHQKNQPFLSRVIHTDTDSFIDANNFKEFFAGFKINQKFLETIDALKREEWSEKNAEMAEEKGIKPSNKSISQYSGAVEGRRNNALYNYIVELVRFRSFSKNEALGAALYENSKNNKPPLEDHIVKEMVSRAHSEYMQSVDDKTRKRIKSGDSLAAKALFIREMRARSYTESQKGDRAKKVEEDDGEEEGESGEKIAGGNAEDFKDYDFSSKLHFNSLTSDLSLVTRLLQRFPEEIKLHENGTITSYDPNDGLWNTAERASNVYEKMLEVFKDVSEEPGVISQFCDNKGNLREKEYERFKASLFSNRKLEDVGRMLKRNKTLITPASEYNKETFQLHCANGVLDLKRGGLIPYNKRYMNTFSTGVYYRGKDSVRPLCELATEEDWVRTSIWTKYIYEIMDGDIEMCNYLHKILGYMLKGENNLELMFFLYGMGANGKSIFIETALEMMGTYASAVPVSIFTTETKGNKETYLAQLPGKRLISTSEVGLKKSWDEEIIKNMSGTDKISARQLYQEGFQYRPAFKTFVRGNHKPIIEGVDLGVWRRIRLMPFNVIIPPEKQDHGLLGKFSTPKMLSHILSFSVAGHFLFMAEGLDAPSTAVLATNEYKSEMNPIPTFIDQCFIPVSDFKDGVTATEMLRVYDQWRLLENQDRLSVVWFGRKLSDNNIKGKICRTEETTARKYPYVIKESWRKRIGASSTKGEKIVSLYS